MIFLTSQLDALDPHPEGIFLSLILGVLLISFSFLSFEQASKFPSGLFSFSGVITDSGARSAPVFCGVFDVRMVTSLLGDSPISLQALLLRRGRIRFLMGCSLVGFFSVMGVLFWGLEVLLILSFIWPVGVSVLSVTENIEWNLPGELMLTLTGADDLSGVFTGLGGFLVFLRPLSVISTIS